MDIKILENLFQLTIERGNLWKRQDQILHKDYGLSWSSQEWKSRMENTIDRGNLRKILGTHCKKLTTIVKNIFSAGLRILQGTKRLFTIERCNLCQRISKERLILKISLWK